MNERGFVSITALLFMFIIAIMILGMSNFAARQSDITRNHKVEMELQCAAESAFNEAAMELINDPDLSDNISGYIKQDWTTEVELINRESWNANSKFIDACRDKKISEDLTVHIYLRKYKKELKNLSNDEQVVNNFMIVIMTLAEKTNYNFNKSAYKKVYGYLSRTVKVNRETKDIDYEDEHYKFKEYFY